MKTLIARRLTPDEVLAKWDMSDRDGAAVELQLAEALREAIQQRDATAEARNGFIDEARRLATKLEVVLAERDEARAEVAQFRSECSHRRYAESLTGRVRQCRNCYRTARLEAYGWDWGN